MEAIGKVPANMYQAVLIKDFQINWVGESMNNWNPDKWLVKSIISD
jgi:hypothetical protein